MKNELNEVIANLGEINDAIGSVVSLATSKSDLTSKVISVVLLSLQSAIAGGGLEKWVEFSLEFGNEMSPIWIDKLSAQRN